MWVALALALVLILSLLFFLAVGSFMVLWHSEAIQSLVRSHEKSVSNLIESHENQVSKMIDGPKLPEVPQLAEVKEADEKWLESKDSYVRQGDDLSPIYDADE